ncbi:MAG: ECF transporter S component, partial [Thermoplasmata archaeon]|nr:ECF transporter S component [Thermoplasmata archaeon]
MSAGSPSDDARTGKMPTYRFSTRDLVTIAVLSALGGVLSAYVGYLGNMVNHILGVPFGAGQFMAGLHVFWMVVAYGLVRKAGASTLTGLLKGMIEMLTGSTHGAVIVLVSLVQGSVYDGGMLFGGRFKDGRGKLAFSYMSAGLAAASNVFIFQALYLSAMPKGYIWLMAVIAFSSGVIFAGYFGESTLETLEEARGKRSVEKKTGRARMTPHKVAALAFACFMVVGSTYYYANIYKLPPEGGGCEITGDVQNPYVYRPGDLSQHELTILAELNGSYTHLPPQNYTGIPLYVLLQRAGPEEDATEVVIRAVDGYSVTFSLEEVMDNERIL